MRLLFAASAAMLAMIASLPSAGAAERIGGDNAFSFVALGDMPYVRAITIASVAMRFSLFASNVVYPQLLELPVATGAGFGLSLLVASLIVMPSGLVMMVLSPIAGRIASRTGPKLLLLLGAISLIAAYGFTLLFSSEVWHILVANILIGAGIGFGYASMPMLIMRSVPQSETGASNGLNALFRSLGTSTAAAVIGAVLASYVVDFEGVPVPTTTGFTISLILGGAAALVALVVALFIPAKRSPQERHPSLRD
jgi:MFS family permease